MSSSSPPSSNIGSVDLESVLNVGRRTLTSIGESSSPLQQQRYTDTIYLKREDHSNSLFSIESKIAIFGELQLLCSIFERYTSNISVYGESAESPSNRTSFSTTFEENEEEEEEDPDTPMIVSTLRQTSISSQSSSPPKASESPIHRTKLTSISHSHTTTSTTSDYSRQNLEGKRYGCIQLPNMTIIEILEILLRTDLELVNKSSNYDQHNVLHQNFIFSQTRHTNQRFGQSSYSK